MLGLPRVFLPLDFLVKILKESLPSPSLATCSARIKSFRLNQSDYIR